ncbi:hypothetical protein DID99_34925 [Burkholderia sp. Bp8986]|nr:hypothetical protein DID99_34925 [Burkholderia sp. Bp8986]
MLAHVVAHDRPLSTARERMRRTLHTKIGQLSLENDFNRRAHQGGIAEREAMIGRGYALPVSQQVRFVGIA